MRQSFCVLFACICMTTWSSGCQKSGISPDARSDVEPEASSALKPDVIHRHSPDVRSTLRISPEVAAITWPGDEWGEPDYFGHRNRKYGAAAKDNFVVELWQCTGPSIIKEKSPRWKSHYFDLLGAAAPPEQGNYFVSAWDLEGNPEQREPTSELDFPDDPVAKDLNESNERPWRPGEFPVTEKWLAANAVPLERLVRALERPHFYSPRVVVDDRMPSELTPLSDYIRDAGRMLASRAMRHAGNRDSESTLHDVLAIRKLGRLCCLQPSWITASLGIALEGLAARLEQTLLQAGPATTKQWISYRQKLDALAPPMLNPERLDQSDRLYFLWICLTVRRKTLDSRLLAPELLKLIEASKPDWNKVLIQCNQTYDEFVEAAKLPTHQQREAAFQAIKTRLKDGSSTLADVKFLNYELATPLPDKITEQEVAFILLQFLSAVYDTPGEAEDRRQTQLDLFRLGVALRAYHDDHQKYPQTLASLAPRYIAAVPADRFTLKPLRYKRRDSGCLVYSVGSNGEDDGAVAYGEGDLTGDDLRLYLGDGKPIIDG